MARHVRLLSYFMVLAFALILGGAAPLGWAGHEDDDDDKEIPFEEAEIFFELNDTDGDLGIHGKIDGGPWTYIAIEDPKERKMMVVRATGRLRRQAMTELFFESAEPSFDELAPEEFFKRFPEGMYEIEGWSQDGKELESEVIVTHIMPAPPQNISVSGIPAAEDCDADLPVVSEPVIISWDFVTESHPEIGTPNSSRDIEIVGYQIVVEREEPTLLVFSVDLPPDVTEVQIPSGFLELGDEFKFEILVREASGNQTAVESCFIIEDNEDDFVIEGNND